MAIQFTSIVPILRIFDVAKADEFYQGFLGFKVDWDHRFDDNAALYRQVSRGDLILHLSEHHGDGSPGARLRVMMRGVEEFHREISTKSLSLHAPWPGKDAMGHAGDGRDRPVRQSHPILRAHRRTVMALRLRYATGCMSAATRLARAGSRSALCGLMRCLTSMTIRCVSESSAQRRVRAAPY
jgi:catechol 2,3-dioxygenase-like lactoylglutathione lyase family enzyme